jgi:hypothetical protein
MKKYFLVSLVFLLSHQLHSQIIKKDGQCIGFGKFILGESITKFTVIAIPGGKYNKDNHEFSIYGYSPPSGEPVEMLNTGFNSILMTFDDSDRLVSFSFLKFYKKKDTPRYEKEAKKYYQQLLDYVAEQLNDKGESKIYYKTSAILDKGQEWNSGNMYLKVKKTTSAYHSTIEVSFNYPGY